MAIKGYLIHNLIHKDVPFFREQIKGWVEAFKKERVTLKTIDNLHALDVIKNEKVDFVLFWDKDIALGYELENLGIKIFNNLEAIRLCDDKAFTNAILKKNKIMIPNSLTMPLTFYQNGLEHFSLIKKKLDEHHLHYPLIVKERCSSLGLGVYLVRTEAQLKALFKKDWNNHLLIQEYIDYEPGKDYRVYLINHRVKAALTRVNKNDYRSNVHLGGKMSVIKKVDPKLLKTAMRASLALHLDFGAVDLVKDKNNNYYVLEVNSNARTISIDKIAKTPLTRSVAKYILSNI